MAILGLPWEFSAADVRGLLETTLAQAAAAADAAAAPDAPGGAAAAPPPLSAARAAFDAGAGGEGGGGSASGAAGAESAAGSERGEREEVPWGVEDVQVVYRDDGKSEVRVANLSILHVCLSVGIESCDAAIQSLRVSGSADTSLA